MKEITNDTTKEVDEAESCFAGLVESLCIGIGLMLFVPFGILVIILAILE